MRRLLIRPFAKRQASGVTGRKPTRRAKSQRARKAYPWPLWVKHEAVSVFAAIKAKAEADHDTEPERSPSPPRRWERRI
jgi:hypothetical protein